MPKEVRARIKIFKAYVTKYCLPEYVTKFHLWGSHKECRLDYNNERPHSSLNNLTPEEFIRQERDRLNLEKLYFLVVQ